MFFGTLLVFIGSLGNIRADRSQQSECLLRDTAVFISLSSRTSHQGSVGKSGIRCVASVPTPEFLATDSEFGLVAQLVRARA